MDKAILVLIVILECLLVASRGEEPLKIGDSSVPSNLSDLTGMKESINGTISGPLFVNETSNTATDGAKKSVPRKGTPGIVKARKGAPDSIEPSAIANSSSIPSSTTTVPVTVKFQHKPTFLEPEKNDDDYNDKPDYTALIVGLSLGIALVLILASVTYWRMRDVWERRQYKRVDFLIDGLYTDT